jgi:hypothetical protein
MTTKKTSGITVNYTETIAIEAFLGYLQKNYSKLINPKDTYLIAAVSAWFHSESGGVKSVIGNNPFNIRPGITSFMSNGYRVSKNGNGKFLTFATLSKGFEATAYLLIHASKTYGYQLALNALKNGGNQAAVDFLAALAMSSWDAAHYGATDWLAAYNPAKNHLLRTYTGITGVQLGNPHPKPRKKKATVPPQKDFNYNSVVRNYLDPWAAKERYLKRHGRLGIAQSMDGTTLRR